MATVVLDGVMGPRTNYLGKHDGAHVSIPEVPKATEFEPLSLRKKSVLNRGLHFSFELLYISWLKAVEGQGQKLKGFPWLIDLPYTYKQFKDFHLSTLPGLFL